VMWGGARPPRALELIGRKADGWIPGGGASRIGEFAGLAARIDDAAAGAGRDPGAIRRIVNVSGSLTDGARGEGPLDGPTDQWVETLTGWAVDLRIDAFIVWPPDPGTTMIERLAAEVIPAVREATRKQV
jgi:hypothetical protein